MYFINYLINKDETIFAAIKKKKKLRADFLLGERDADIIDLN